MAFVFAVAGWLQAMSFKQDACPDDSIETSWISRKSPMIDVCTAMRSIDGTDFYQKYLLKVNFENVVGNRFKFSPEGDGPASYTILTYRPKTKVRRSDGEPGPEREDYVEIGHWSENNLTIYEKQLKSWWPDDERFPISRCSLDCEVGYRKQLIKDEQCCWACAKCEPYEWFVVRMHA